MADERTIASLDGIRALAIIAVVLGHSHSLYLESSWLTPFRNGSLGVVGFFVLSGFLITGILLREIDNTGTIRVGRFYARRAFRIFPAFYVFLLVVGCLGLAHVYDLDLRSFLAAATYTWNYSLGASSYIISQVWSLSLEEQFYFLWPLCLLFLSKRTCLRIALGSILLSPLSRVLTYTLFPSLRGHINMMLHTHIDAIMTGSALALAQNVGVFVQLRSTVAKNRWLLMVAIYFAVQPTIVAKSRGYFTLPIGMTLDELGWAIVVLHVTRHPKLLLGRFLNSPLIVHIGRISYSVYLWQTPFLGEHQGPFPLNLLWILLCAEGSYWLIEKPFLRLRDLLFDSGFMPSRYSPSNLVSKSVRFG